MMNEKILGTYADGNTLVVIFKDGTKIRYVIDGEDPSPDFPESMDLKITTRCDLGCPMCAENSLPDGKYADLNHQILDTIKPYTELAIGGGNPLCHPGLNNFLCRMRDRHVICSLTVNAKHFMSNIPFFRHLRDNNLVHGIGVSIPFEIPDGLIAALQEFPNAVIHTIAGVTPMHVFDHLAGHNLNLLVLGFKSKGNGWDFFIDHAQESIDTMIDLGETIREMRGKFKAIGFDNLAVKQLKLDKIIQKEEFDRLYMGDDGEYTMYIDLVEEKYGKSSTHQLRPIDQPTVTALFKQLKEKP